MSAIIQTKPAPSCPSCGARMILRRPKPGGKDFKTFWGCNRWPDCHGTRNIDSDGKPEQDEEDWSNHEESLLRYHRQNQDVHVRVLHL